MANAPDFIAHLREVMRVAGLDATSKPMFGGHGLYADGLFFAIVDDDVLYLKVDDETRAEFEALDCPPFEYMTKDGVKMAMSYRRAPDEALERPDAMRPWARAALGAAMRAAAGKRNSARKKAARR
jgi:DNA transformation protein